MHDTSSARPAPAAGADLRTYAPIGDGRTVALIGRNGRVDWMPLPNLDSTPVFARLLDDATGGCIDLEPVEPYTVTRRYVADTNVLTTTYETASGRARVTDAMVTGVAGRLPWAELARRVEGLSGAVEFAWAVTPGTRLQTAGPWLERVHERRILRVGATSLAVDGEHHGESGADDVDGRPAISGRFDTDEGSRHLIVISATDGEPLHFPVPANVQRGIERTVDQWRLWSREFGYDGPWAPHVQRSALALKLLVYSPTGAIAAAATTSLPENPRGGKNWEYRLAWVRDLAYTARALVRFGLREETHASISWLVRTIREQGPDLHVMYDLGGGTIDGTREFDVDGWRGIGPVVAGNPANDQLQLGVYGDLFSICRTYVDAGNVLDTETGRLLADMADRTCDLWRNPDSGMWELAEVQHYTSSKMGCWQALRDAVHLGELGVIPGPVERWRDEMTRVEAWVHEHGWSEQAGAYVMHPGTTDLDASVLLHAESGFDRGTRMSQTIDRLTAELGAGPLLYRYTGMDREEHTFVACAFWRAGALACVGRHDEAVAAMDDLVARGNDVGIFAEMISEHDGAFWGNLPQALSHLALVNAALTMERLVPEEVLGDR
ncbi:glycoside hydrolase family 15 protein [Microbacterium aquimaris]|uniref:Glycoside hydrolase family 15 protein n=1 Tax=Microbacterium aquimaris TaxID=459816 RepID=A0ABU5N5G1_9MICO|nr:glycoside hydrolase family 15 protein [Microbacterium aquimaris]MDZ8161300.1 glycoside hydrolase family 15 protein [Microbacterium aquimaris]